MKIGIIGAGAMGCLYACFLSRKHDVTLYDVDDNTIDTISKHGIIVTSPDDCAGKRYDIAIKKSGEGGAACDIAIVFVKDIATDIAVSSNLGIIGDGTLLISLQNGMGNEEILEKYLPRERILLGTTKHNCVVRSAGHIYHSGSGITRIGSVCADKTACLKVLCAFEECGIEISECDNIKHLLWEKLFVNMTINPVTSLLGCHISEVYRNSYVRSAVRKLIDEAVAVAGCDGESFDADAVFAGVVNTAKALSSGTASMAQDIEHGRKTEIDFINGSVVRLGKKYGICTPCHEMITMLIHSKETLSDRDK